MKRSSLLVLYEVVRGNKKGSTSPVDPFDLHPCRVVTHVEASHVLEIGSVRRHIIHMILSVVCACAASPGEDMRMFNIILRVARVFWLVKVSTVRRRSLFRLSERSNGHVCRIEGGFTSYACSAFFQRWWRELNPRIAVLQTAALATSPHHRVNAIWDGTRLVLSVCHPASCCVRG
jgi:hypothetical protein